MKHIEQSSHAAMVIALTILAFQSTSAIANLKIITSEAEFRALRKQTNPIMIEFAAPWCAVCKEAQLPLEELAKDPEFAYITFAYVDTTQLGSMADEYKVAGIPTFIYFNKGKKVGESIGVKNMTTIKDDLRTSIRENLPKKLTAITRATALQSLIDAPAQEEPVAVQITDVVAEQQPTLTSYTPQEDVMALEKSNIGKSGEERTLPAGAMEKQGPQQEPMVITTETGEVITLEQLIEAMAAAEQAEQNALAQPQLPAVESPVMQPTEPGEVFIFEQPEGAADSMLTSSPTKQPGEASESTGALAKIKEFIALVLGAFFALIEWAIQRVKHLFGS